VKYLAQLSLSRMVLCCYFIWYVVFVVRYFDSTAAIWLTALGISVCVGFALLLSTWTAHARFWSFTTTHLFLVPFCVSSFSALVKDRGFILIFSPHQWENGVAGGLCVLFCLFAGATKLFQRGNQPLPEKSDAEQP
jgi:hypothetical protein